MKRVVMAIVIFFLFTGPVWAKKPLVVTSIFPLAEMVKFIGGQEIESRLLMPPGADPHSWEPTPKDILKLHKASLLVAVGGGLEPWLDDVLVGLEKSQLKILFMYEGSEPLEHHHKDLGHTHPIGLDPHLWLDFRRDAVFAKRLANALAEILPAKRKLFIERGQELANKFLTLDNAFRASLAKCRVKIVPLAGHQAFTYWEKNYGLHFIALSGLSPEAEPTPRAISKLIKIMQAQNIKAIYYSEPHSLRFARIIAKETGAQIYYLSTGAWLTREEFSKGVSFFELMWRNLKNLCQGLDCQCEVSGQN